MNMCQKFEEAPVSFIDFLAEFHGIGECKENEDIFITKDLLRFIE